MKKTGYRLPFVYGVQYYRAPTPHRDCWRRDLEKIRELGFDTVKFWVQWRWSERREGEYYWEDLDELMRLAEDNHLRVVLNLILDVMPGWVERDYPESLMVDRFGRTVVTQTTLCRQLGGYPGPCYSHEAMTQKRLAFFQAAVRHFKPCKALWSWDVWNEPERDLLLRSPDHVPELCYCDSCRSGFLAWLRNKYRTIEELNRTWGRCYNDFEEVELPVDPGTVNDFIDWRIFQAEVLTHEARLRLNVIRELDHERFAHLHIVPDTGCFSVLSCVDDFALGRKCDIFGSTMVNDPYLCAQAVSAADGRYFYNAEWHINFGSNAIYQRIAARNSFLYDLIPQLGWGVRGFLYWQYRSETLGTEAPAWGLVKTDGSSRPVTELAAEFARRFQPWRNVYMNCVPRQVQVLIYRSSRNEIYQFCRHGNLTRYHETLRNYCKALYALNLPFAFADETALRHNDGKAGLLILPQVYYVSESEAQLFETFRKAGGVIFSEGNLAAYNSDTGCFSDEVPGCGLAKAWNICETDATSSYYLPSGGNDMIKEAKGDVRKALDASGGGEGGEFFPIRSCRNGTSGDGAVDFAVLESAGSEPLATFHGIPCVIRRDSVFYAGTMLGYGAGNGMKLLTELLREAAATAGLTPVDSGVRLDILTDAEGTDRFVIAVNCTGEQRELSLPEGNWQELFERSDKIIPPRSALLFVRGEQKERC